ncbi:amidohydrolase family protein [Kribbella italica]|uniref:Cytosine deaminase n=1 Tax=Kribbella italica TaxID=1540520 RepID=A0A7W9JGN2_9ACTN|nr:cytosine deaminase [Kribbella italica]
MNVLSGAQLADGNVVDVLVDGEYVRGVGPAGSLRDHPGEHTDLRGFLLVEATVEPHAHLDKTRTWDDVGCTSGELTDAVAAWHHWSANRHQEDVRRRADLTLTEMLANGTTVVRTHVDVLPGPDPLVAVRALLALRDDWRDRLDLQIVPLLFDWTPDEIALEAVSAGVDLIGGCPHLAADPAQETHRLVMLAERCELGLDLHVDESLDPTVRTLAVLANLVTERGFPHPVTAGHCVSLGQLPPEDLRATIEVVADAGIQVVALPQTNLYLQGRGLPNPQPRGLTAVSALAAAGVTVAGGGDNIADPFNPMGRADALETASLLVTAAHLPVPMAFEAVSRSARRVVDDGPAGPEAGRRADLLAIRAATLADAVGRAPVERIVWRAGREVARTTVLRQVAEQ